MLIQILSWGIASIIGLSLLLYLALPYAIFERSQPRNRNNETKVILNATIPLSGYTYFQRADIMSMADSTSRKDEGGIHYLPSREALRDALPLPSFLLSPLAAMKLEYEPSDPGAVVIRPETKVAIYVHGSGSVSEENSILQQELVREGYVVIRLSYAIDCSGQERVTDLPSMLKRMAYIEQNVSPLLKKEIRDVMTELYDLLPSLAGQELVLIAHSIGADPIFGLAASGQFPVSKIINLDGTMTGSIVDTGVNVPQLHLSQSQGFHESWLDDEIDPDEPPSIRSLGRNNGIQTRNVIINSEAPVVWIRVEDATHFTFTDFPYLIRDYSFAKNIAGPREAADRIRHYIHTFLDHDAASVSPDNVDTLVMTADISNIL